MSLYSELGENGGEPNMLSSTLKSLFAVAENYPKLQANENFMQLQEELTGTENKIAYSRQHYNDMVMTFNTKIQTFPNNVFMSRIPLDILTFETQSLGTLLSQIKNLCYLCGF